MCSVIEIRYFVDILNYIDIPYTKKKILKSVAVNRNWRLQKTEKFELVQ
jgi:hypothetical protein